MRSTILFGGLVAVAFLGCGGDDTGGDITDPGSRPVNSVSIVSRAETQGENAFSPSPITVAVNGVVRWYNDDRAAAGGEYGGASGTTHTVTADDLSFASGNLTPNRSFERAFAAAGTYNYHCSIHPTMKGRVTVTP